MGIITLEDDGRAVLYNTTYERPFGPGFIGDDARDQAELFLQYTLMRLPPKANALDMPSTTWDAWSADFHSRFCCRVCGDLAVDHDLRSGDDDMRFALNLGGIHDDGLPPPAPIERSCEDCWKGPHDGLGPIRDINGGES